LNPTKHFNPSCYLSLLLLVLISSDTFLNVINVIGEYYYFYLRIRQFVNLRLFVKFVYQI
jgi:hypothetical protein